ncbi:MAG: hypothetical protein GXP37_05065 [Chloroflexi bacterium]|nr:hypothetical protein [Chloroflexota bacterium]
MSRTNKERILDYLWSISPDWATNGRIREETGIKSHQQVYLLTQELLRKGLIRGEQHGREWVFWANESPAFQLASPGPAAVLARADKRISPHAFEKLARKVMSDHFGVPLRPGSVPGVPKRFDLVSPDKNVVGDAKYFTLVRGQRLPPAKFSIIAEHVWLLEKTGAPVTFLVFGNDRQVPELWLGRYGGLVSGVAFFFLRDDGVLKPLQEARS